MYTVVVATPDIVGERMAGPGIRAWHIAQELNKHFPTTLVSRGTARDAMRTAAVVFGQPARGLRRRHRGQRLVFDLFDPVLLELRELYGPHRTARQQMHILAEKWRLRRALTAGDLFVCATPQQRQLYAAVADRLIEVPFGVEQNVPISRARDDVIVWGGGIWEWLDPETAVNAIVRLNRDGIPCRLLFLGRTRPNDRIADRAERFDALLAAGSAYVSVREDWVPYHDRFAALSRCRIAIMLHRDTPEAKYSIRTRLFDAIAAAIPIVATRDGFAADLIERERLGIVVPSGDVDAVAGALRKLLRDDDFYAQCVSRLEHIRPRFAWDIVTRPLVEALERWKSE